MASPSELNLLQFASAARHLLVGKYFESACVTFLMYDHILTFSTEVERIWKQRMTGASMLFLINRYITPISVIIITEAYDDPVWDHSVRKLLMLLVLTLTNLLIFQACTHFVPFVGSTNVLLVAVCELIMILRVYALYGHSLRVLIFLMTLWIIQLIMGFIGIANGFPVPLPPGLVGCIFTSTNTLFSAQWVFPLVTDAFVFGLTLWRSGSYLMSGNAPTLQRFARDGIMYFFVIFMANLMNTLIYFLAPKDLKAVGAAFSKLITSTMVSRLVLNLRSPSALAPSGHLSRGVQLTSGAHMKFVTLTVGNLGEEMQSSYDDDHFDTPLSDQLRYLR
ncbi:hypothetical protein BDZ94DRAFT_1306148 [Collybia nuda]|uniref:DUF6533 domain-containing protein n=1 Tax=Collybia nuda TaxID=64659 RepID=A0A9P6CN40_9AGAR|nr:hypothetical protein BDZ94DRAFT_1306148 [Collybia nuda]